MAFYVVGRAASVLKEKRVHRIPDQLGPVVSVEQAVKKAGLGEKLLSIAVHRPFGSAGQRPCRKGKSQIIVGSCAFKVINVNDATIPFCSLIDGLVVPRIEICSLGHYIDRRAAIHFENRQIIKHAGQGWKVFVVMQIRTVNRVGNRVASEIYLLCIGPFGEVHLGGSEGKIVTYPVVEAIAYHRFLLKTKLIVVFERHIDGNTRVQYSIIDNFDSPKVVVYGIVSAFKQFLPTGCNADGAFGQVECSQIYLR